jgi:OmpA-OmpF porin, OOP family
LLATTPVQAADGLYLGLGAGVNFAEDSDVTGTGVNATADYDTGYSIIGAIGHSYRNKMRGEFELGYQDLDVGSVSGSSAGSGDVDVFSFMINGFYDFKNKSKWTPYVGVGIGGANVSADGVSNVSGSVLDDSDLVFAYQAMGGLTYQVNSNLGLFADYRYFGTSDADLTLANNTDVDADFASHRIMFGMRWHFGAPKPAPAPMMTKAEPKPMPMAKAEPAPMPKPKLDIPQTFIVFFDWDKSNLTSEAQSIVDSAAKFSKQGKIARIVATGHADRSGKDTYNKGLSQRRAEAVKAELVRLGILPTGIATLWEGEQSPLVNTKDGVREPQNRRVEIILKK